MLRVVAIFAKCTVSPDHLCTHVAPQSQVQCDIHDDLNASCDATSPDPQCRINLRAALLPSHPLMCEGCDKSTEATEHSQPQARMACGQYEAGEPIKAPFSVGLTWLAKA